jgi:molecular chaperone GrpE (heat shock protein)
MTVMHDPSQFKVNKWPFFFGDALMLGVAYFIYWQGAIPLAQWEVITSGVCVALGALLGIMPFLLEYRGVLKIIEASAVGSAAEKIQNLDTIAAQVSSVANLWENANQQSDKTAAVAKEIFDRMEAELRDFKEFLKKAGENEKATLRLEVEKLRRAEADWLQILVRIFDHVFALYTAAERSGQEQIIKQLGQFQNACRDTARRIGLVPFVADRSEPFDAKRHKWADGEKPEDGALVTETVATGYTFQGRQIRPALVRLQANGSAGPQAGESDEDESEESKQERLPLEAGEP